jgi:glycosyltransferase involved in cell wall biosynthesis
MMASYLIPVTRFTVQPQWVGRCIKSACEQTIRDIEIIVADCTGEFAYNDERIKVLRVGNMPLVESMNLMVDTAKSDVMLLMCDDDWDEPNRAEIVCDKLKELDIFAGSYNRCSEDGNFIEQMITKPFVYDEFLHNGLSTPICAGGFRKSTCPKFDVRVPLLNDYLMILQASLSGARIGVGNEIVSNFRVHYSQLSGGSPRNHQIRIEEKRFIFNMLGVK